MTMFHESDIEDTGKILTIWLPNDQDDLKYWPLDWQKRGLWQTASGYGARLTTHWKICFEGRFYRLYATCRSNAASLWFVTKGRKIFVS
jgi:hypothetical protein